MTTPPLLTLPSSSCIASVVMTIERVVSQTKSPFTLEAQEFIWPGEAWMVDFQLPPIVDPNAAAEWRAFGVSLKGSFGRFLIGDPSAKTPRGSALGSPVVDGSNQTGNTLLTRGWTPNQTNALRKGDYIQLGTLTTSRLHMVIDDVNADSSGEAPLSIEPALRYSPVDGAAIITEDAKGLFKLMSNTFSWSVSPGKVNRFSFQAEEVVGA